MRFSLFVFHTSLVYSLQEYNFNNDTNVTLSNSTCDDFPDDGFNYTFCVVENCSRIGDGICDFDLSRQEGCNEDGGDCSCDFPDDGFDYSLCDVSKPCNVGDGFCDEEKPDLFCRIEDGSCNGEENYFGKNCNFDGGDCGVCKFPDDGFNYSLCDVQTPCWIGDGYCDRRWGYNTDVCNLDGGDCTLSSELWWFLWVAILFLNSCLLIEKLCCCIG